MWLAIKWSHLYEVGIKGGSILSYPVWSCLILSHPVLSCKRKAMDWENANCRARRAPGNYGGLGRPWAEFRGPTKPRTSESTKPFIDSTGARCAGNGVLIEIRKKLKTYRDTSRPALRPIDETNLLDREENKEEEGGDGGHNALLAALSAICNDQERAGRTWKCDHLNKPPESWSWSASSEITDDSRAGANSSIRGVHHGLHRTHVLYNEWLCRGEGSIRLLQADLSEKQLKRPILRNRSKVSSDVKKALYIVQLICQSRGSCVHNFNFLYCAFVYLGAQF
jgi:hypothetical protein